MNWKEKYKILIEEIAKKPFGTFPIYDLPYRPDFFNKCFIVGGEKTFNFRLNSKLATEQDYKDFCEYLCDRTGQELGFFFVDNIQKFNQFSKKQKDA